MQLTKLHRNKNHREMMLRNQVTSLLLYEKITSTKVKVSQVKSMADKIITLAKENTLVSKRKIFSYLLDKNAAKKLYAEILPRVESKNSGYFTTFKVSQRLGDNAEMVVIQLFDYKPIEKPKSTEEEVETESTKLSRLEAKQQKKIEKLSKDQLKGEVKTIVRKKGERRISGEK